ncbi:MAG: hypothetical protein P1U89_04310 [Verrucomicrobiales bacterium]|nr:hypothetical protein [Verrucomicrobiales bacterium]
MIRRIFWLLIFVVGLGWLVWDGLERVRREAGIRSMLLAVQTALQDYHVDQEQYIPRESLTGAEIITVLSDFDFLPELPYNPWSGTQWKLDGKEPDHLVYQTDPNFETYALRALDPKSGAVVMELDSESNPSLE